MAKLSAKRRLAALDSLAAVLLGSVRRQIEWPDVVTLADELLVMPALARAVSDRAGRNGDEPPAALADQLRNWHRGNMLRNARLRRQLLEAVGALNAAGITPLLFKGALHLLDGSLSRIGDRYMSDLDLMVPSGQFAAARAALEELGYVPEVASPFHQPHELGFYRAGTGGPIDAHTEFGGEPLLTVLPAATAWRDSAEVPIGEGRARGLSPTHQVLHNVLHAAVLDLNHAVGGLPFRQLLALGEIVRAHGPAIDWPALARQMAGHGLARELRDYLWLARRFAGAAVPPPAPTSAHGWGWRPRVHELRVRAGFALGWPPHLQRNLHYAFGRAYLESLYATDAGGFSLARARARHAVKLLRGDPSRALGASVLRRL